MGFMVYFLSRPNALSCCASMAEDSATQFSPSVWCLIARREMSVFARLAGLIFWGHSVMFMSEVASVCAEEKNNMRVSIRQDRPV